MLDKRISFPDDVVVHEIADAVVSANGWTLIRLACKKMFEGWKTVPVVDSPTTCLACLDVPERKREIK